MNGEYFINDTSFGPTVVRKLIACQSVDGHFNKLTSPWREIADAIESCPPIPGERTIAFEAAIANKPNSDQIRINVFAADINDKLEDLVINDSDFPSEYEIPTLPLSAQVPQELGMDACLWLDNYIDFSRQWAPRAYTDFHEAVAIWILSTIAARRVMANLGKQRFTNIYIALVSRTSFFSKTTVAEIGIQALDNAGLSWLLANDSSTPQKFLADQADHTISIYESLDDEGKAWAELNAWSAGQRGWYYEEFGDQIRNMMSEGGFMADFRGILRRWDDTPEHYAYATIGRGTDKIYRPYLALLANMTPDDLRPYAKRGSTLWGDGFLSRYALITPPENIKQRGRFPKGERCIPNNLIAPLQKWNQSLGIPNLVVKDIPGKDGKASSIKRVEFNPLKLTPLTTPPEVLDAFYAYHDGLLDSIADTENHDLDGNYARMAEKAFRVAMLLASVSGSNQIQLNHWARAQTITERWRVGLHELYSQVNTKFQSPEREKEDDVMRHLTKLGTATATEVARFIRNLSTTEAARILDGLVSNGVIKTGAETQKGTKRYEII